MEAFSGPVVKDILHMGYFSLLSKVSMDFFFPLV